ncbi:DUF6069 family protein [Kribbella sp. NPDC049227]|uniref:DUF6069 family protein n=1 Tax=Kribbella sp. NPDC049227 TaxID=3364113 RepID=UPI00371A8B53
MAPNPTTPDSTAHTAPPLVQPESVGVTRPTRVPGRSRLAVVGVTAAAALILWAILAPLAGITLEAQQGTTMHIGAAQVFFASAAMAFAGWGLLAILERSTFNARNVWTVVAVIACVLSLASPLLNGIDAGAKLGLASLHLVVGAAVILGLRRTALTARQRC